MNESTSDKSVPQKTGNKLERFLELSQEIRDFVQKVVDTGSKRLQSEGQGIPLRDQVLIGLVFKIYGSLECLTEDARNGRSEAVHHLKTLVEAYIYFHWVGQETDDKRATLVLSWVCKEKVRFFQKNLDICDQSDYDPWKTAYQNYSRELEGKVTSAKKKKVGEMASDVSRELKQWYDRVYRLACEQAHMSDLTEYMPLPRGPIRVDHSRIHLLRVHVALHYGLEIGCDLLKNINEMYELGLDKNIRELKTRYDAIRTMTAA